MAYLHGLIFAAIFFALQTLSFSAHALSPTYSCTAWKGVNYSGGPWATWQSRANSVYGSGNYTSTVLETLHNNVNDVQVTCTNSYCGIGNKLTFWCSASTATDPANATCTGGTCTCNEGYKEEGGVCVVDDPCVLTKGQQITGCVPVTGPDWVYTNSNGCYYFVAGGNNQFWKDGTQQFCGTWVSMGEKSQDSSLHEVSVQETLPPPTCGATKCLGEYNGQTMCLPCDNKGAGGDTDKQKSNISTTTVDNGDGTTTTTTTKTDGTTTTTTTTTKDSEGNVTGTNTDSQYEKESVGNASSSCSEAPSCGGDPVQCAQLRQQWETMCALTGDEQLEGRFTDALDDEGKGILEANPGIDGGTINLPGQLDQTAFLGSATCPQDQVISLGTWGSLTLPWSSLCGHLQLAGNGIVLISLLLGMRIMTSKGES